MKSRSGMLLAFAIAVVALILISGTVLEETKTEGHNTVATTFESGLVSSRMMTTTPQTDTWPPASLSTHVDSFELSINDLIEASDVVAEVSVESIGDIRFNTADASMPAAGDMEGLHLWAPVFLKVEQYIRPVQIPPYGLVMSQPGGTIGNFSYNISNAEMFTSQSHGLAFFVLLPTDPPSTESQDIKSLASVAAQHSTSGQEYLPAAPVVFFEYEDGQAKDKENGVTMTISDLLSQIASHP